MKDWLRFLFYFGRFHGGYEKSISSIIVSPMIDFCSAVISCGIIHEKFSEIETENIINFQDCIGEAFNFPKNTNDGEKIFSGILESADDEQLIFRIQDLNVSYGTSLRKNRKKKEQQISNFKQLAVVRKEKFSFVEKIEKELDLKSRPAGIEMNSSIFRLFGSGAAYMSSQSSNSIRIIDVKKRIKEEAEAEFNIQRIEYPFNQTVKFREMMCPDFESDERIPFHTTVSSKLQDDKNEFGTTIISGSRNICRNFKTCGSEKVIGVISPSERYFNEALSHAEGFFRTRKDDVILPESLIDKLPASFDIQAWTGK